MTHSAFATAALIFTTLSGAALAADPARYSALDNSGAEVGSIALTGEESGALLRVELAPGAITPGWHGMHFHAVADCSDLEKFKSAKAHINLGNGMHGLLSAQGPESGDLPNIWVAADGSAHAEVATQLLHLTDLLDADGSALIIHDQPDDQTSQPIGNSGDRRICAAIK